MIYAYIGDRTVDAEYFLTAMRLMPLDFRPSLRPVAVPVAGGIVQVSLHIYRHSISMVGSIDDPDLGRRVLEGVKANLNAPFSAKARDYERLHAAVTHEVAEMRYQTQRRVYDVASATKDPVERLAAVEALWRDHEAAAAVKDAQVNALRAEVFPQTHDKTWRDTCAVIDSHHEERMEDTGPSMA